MPQEIPHQVLADLSQLTAGNIHQIHNQQIDRLLQLAQEGHQEVPDPDMDWQETGSQLELYDWEDQDDQ